MQDEQLTDAHYNELIDAFSRTLKSIPSGKENAYEYHKFISGLLTFVFYPSLSNPKDETPIDNERKRIDITYINTAEKGFFKNLKSEITSNYIYVECKNYSGKVSNPEFDQLSGRYNESSSKVGLLVCRKISDIDEAYERVSAQFRRKTELSLIITDETIYSMLNAMKVRNENSFDELNHENTLYNIKRKIEVEKY